MGDEARVEQDVSGAVVDAQGWPDDEELKAQITRAGLAPTKAVSQWMSVERQIEILTANFHITRNQVRDELVPLRECVKYVLEAEDLGSVQSSYPAGHSPLKRLRDRYNEHSAPIRCDGGGWYRLGLNGVKRYLPGSCVPKEDS